LDILHIVNTKTVFSPKETTPNTFPSGCIYQMVLNAEGKILTEVERLRAENRMLKAGTSNYERRQRRL